MLENPHHVFVGHVNFGICRQSPEFHIRSSQIIRQSRSDSPRSITCKGVEPSRAGFGVSSHGPTCETGITSASASKSRKISEEFL
jgi:hypothetical protein